MCPLCSREFSAVSEFCDDCSKYVSDIRAGLDAVDTLSHDEVFVPIEGIDGYSISNYGNVRNDATDQLRKPSLDAKGLKLNLKNRKSGKTLNFYVHRLVAMYFLDNFKQGFMIDFKNGDSTDCYYKNLEMTDIRVSAGNRKK